MATEVLEHCPEPQVIINEVYRVLEDKAVFFMTVPFIWNLHEVPYDEYRYTPFALKRLLQNAGFRQIDIKAHGGWNASLALMLAMWCRRYWKNPLPKFAFSVLFVTALQDSLSRKHLNIIYIDNYLLGPFAQNFG